MPASAVLAAVAFVFATLSLLWPAMLHGKPFLFPDSTAYVRAVDAAVYKSFGVATEWTRPGEVERLSGKAQPSTNPAAAAAPGSEQAQVAQNRVPLMGRSFYYGIFAYASVVLGGFWFLAMLQAGTLAAAVLLFVADRTDQPVRKRLWIGTLTVLFLAAGSTAPFFTSFVMPDIFAGLAILAAAMLMFSPLNGRARTLFWFLLASAAALFHSSHVLILSALAVIGAVIILRQPGRKWGGAGLVFAAAVVGLLGDVVFARSVEYALGSPPVRPPFLTARLIDDGPGLRYLDENCGKDRFFVCEFRERLPQGSDNFLWSTNPAEGVFNTLDPAGKRRLAQEQGRFVLQVASAYPLDVLASSATSAARQLGLMRLSEFRVIDQEGQSADPASVPQSASSVGTGKLAPYVDAYANYSVAIALLALLALPFLVRRGLIDGRLALLIVSGVVVNALICGGLSTPHDRYGARVLWVVPLLAASGLSRLASLPRLQHLGGSKPVPSR